MGCSGSEMKVHLYTDGGSRGNPGPGAGAYLLQTPAGELIESRAIYQRETTNNIAEYTAVLEGLRAAQKRGAKELVLFSDSELLIRQLNGQYKVKSENLLPLYEACRKLLAGFDRWKAEHIPREKNAGADKLANEAMDLQRDIFREGSWRDIKPIRLGILLSGGGRTMVNLHQEIQAGRLPAQIVLVISSRSTVAGVQRAREIGLEPVIIRRKDFADIHSFSERIAEELDRAKVDLAVQAGWLCLWEIPERYENRVMNIHPALLPSFGGQGMWGHHVHEAVLKAGCKVSGCTVHFCTNDYDAGPIIVQRCCPVFEGDDADTLAARVFREECIAYPEAIRLFAAGRLTVENGVVHIRN
ncbi:MAG TPA: phosphoribosylglycinamide formyltransferase [Anaerohalosphaeraceae bacterium]|nr:phosphoribosylglycinamide formyltransferase [Anaerohalosphaeraceae bacterium]